MKLWAIFFAVLAIQCAQAQGRAKALPKFEDYPVTEMFTGTPHAPILTTPKQKAFRTRIRDGVAKGWGVRIGGEWGKFQDGPGPNFAGHYIVIFWGCGSGCNDMAMADAKTGIVYDPPSDNGSPLVIYVPPGAVSHAAEMQFRKNSRLMIVWATPEGSQSYTYYFLWEATRWKLLRRIPVKPD